MGGEVLKNGHQQSNRCFFVQNLSYRGSGQSSLVVAAIIDKLKYVWRLRKDKATGEVSAHSDAEESLRFVTNFIQPMLGKHYVPTPDLLCLNPSILAMLKQIVPLNKTIGDMLTIIQLPDRCFLNLPVELAESHLHTFAIEIKPKRGFVLPAEYGNTNTHYCRNCAAQVHKLKVGKVKVMYDYCPLQLFSGDCNNMRQSLLALFSTPQRSIRVFCDGKCIYGDESSLSLSAIIQLMFTTCHVSTSEFLDFIIDMLLAPLEKSAENASVMSSCLAELISGVDIENNNLVGDYNDTMSSSDVVSPRSLPEGCVLERILRMQKMDTIGLEAAYTLYKDFKFSHDDRALLSNLFDPVATDALALDPTSRGQLALLRAFLLSCTVCDCSIMLTYRRLSETSSFSNATSGVPQATGHVLRGPDANHYQFDVAVIDLDAKAPQKIEGYWKRYKETLEYLELLESTGFSRVRPYCF